MKPLTVGHVTIGALAVLTAFVAVAVDRVVALDARLAELVQPPPETIAVQYLETLVTRPDGTVTKVHTERREGETYAQLRARHDAMARELRDN